MSKTPLQLCLALVWGSLGLLLSGAGVAHAQVIEYTDMTEWRRTDGSDAPGAATLEVSRKYRLEPGHAGTYDIRAIHAIDYPDGARFVRVTGTDLEHVPRLKFDVAKGEAQIIESVTTGQN